jgi:hypothetical protein
MMLTTARTIQLLAVGALLLTSACSETERGSIFNPEVGHSGNWISDHGQAALDEGNTCPECHGTDLSGGDSELSCFTTQYEGVGCHESGVGKRHTAGWSLESEHGRVVKQNPGVSSGMGSCQACHGNDYEGGSSEISCASCHGVAAPHPESPWLRSPGSHHDVNEQNAPVCAECHENPEVMELPGCFNGSLCHGERGSHPADWLSPDQHGASAKEDPGTGGFGECQVCHGTDFRGGTAEVSCFSCHEIDAPHPRFGWTGGGESHRATGEGNAPVCAGCHSELQQPPDCFAANGCHSTAPDDGQTEEAPPGDEGATDSPLAQENGGDAPQ